MTDIIDIISHNTRPSETLEKIMNHAKIRAFIDSKEYRTELEHKLEYFKRAHGCVPWIEAIPHVVTVVNGLQKGTVHIPDSTVIDGKDTLNELVRTKTADERAFARFIIAQYSLLRLFRNGLIDFKHLQHCSLYAKPVAGEDR